MHLVLSSLKKLKISIISDTHSYIDAAVLAHLKQSDEIWHAGDFGSIKVLEQLQAIAPVRAVWGNIDGHELRQQIPEEQLFTVAGVKVYMIHIGGYPPKYTTKLRHRLDELQPKLFICGHSHILKIIPDAKRQLLHINPGAAGRHGFHKERTLVQLYLNEGKMEKAEVVELGKRSALK